MRTSTAIILVGLVVLVAMAYAKEDTGAATASSRPMGPVRKLLSVKNTLAAKAAGALSQRWLVAQCKDGGWYNGWNGLCLDTRYDDAKAYCSSVGSGFYGNRCRGPAWVLCCRID
jgi:hypothetical protein